MHSQTGAAEDRTGGDRVVFVFDVVVRPARHFADYAGGMSKGFIEACVLGSQYMKREGKLLTYKIR